MLRNIGGIVAGVVAAFAVVLAVELIGMQIFPQPADMNPLDPESVRRHLPEISPGSFAMVLLAWGLASIGGPMVTRKIVGPAPKWPALTVIALFAVLCAYNLMTVPTPPWMIPAAVIIVGASSVLAMRLSGART